jgi:hypothetical protein
MRLVAWFWIIRLVLLIFVQGVQGTCFRFPLVVLRDLFPDSSQVDAHTGPYGNHRYFSLLIPTDLYIQ